MRPGWSTWLQVWLSWKSNSPLKSMVNTQNSCKELSFAGEKILRSSECVADKRKKKNYCKPFDINIKFLFFVYHSFLQWQCLWIAKFWMPEKSNHNFDYTFVILLKYWHYLANNNSYNPCKFCTDWHILYKTVELFLGYFNSNEFMIKKPQREKLEVDCVAWFICVVGCCQTSTGK